MDRTERPVDDRSARAPRPRAAPRPSRTLNSPASWRTHGPAAELARGRHWAPWVLLALVALVVIAGLGLAGQVVGGNDRHINVIVALVSLLGLHALTLLLWLVGLWLPSGTFGTASLGWLWLSLTARVAGGAGSARGAQPRGCSRVSAVHWALGLVSLHWRSRRRGAGRDAVSPCLSQYTLSWENDDTRAPSSSRGAGAGLAQPVRLRCPMRPRAIGAKCIGQATGRGGSPPESRSRRCRAWRSDAQRHSRPQRSAAARLAGALYRKC